MSANECVLYDSQVYIPAVDQIKVDILREHHDAKIVGHLGQEKTLESLMRSYYSTLQKYCQLLVDLLIQLHHKIEGFPIWTLYAFCSSMSMTKGPETRARKAPQPSEGAELPRVNKAKLQSSS
jgi:hypothetical protein